MSLTAAQILTCREWCGGEAAISDTELNTLAATFGADPLRISRHVLAARRADILTGATEWSADGDYSEKTTEQLRELSKLIELLDREIADADAALAGDDGDTTSRTDTVGSLSRSDRERLFGR